MENGTPFKGPFEAYILDCHSELPSKEITKRRDFVTDRTGYCYRYFLSRVFHGGCSESSNKCDFHFYGIPENFKIAVYSKQDGKFYYSNEYRDNKVYEKYITFDIGESEWSFDFVATNSLLFKILLALILSIIIEATTAWVFLHRSSIPIIKFILKLIAINLLTVPFLWYSLYFLLLPLLLLECIVTTVELTFYLILFRKRIDERRLMVFCLVANILSFVTGLIIW